MTQTPLRTGSARSAAETARTLETPSEVLQFEQTAGSTAGHLAFLTTPEWAEIRDRIMGDGHPPTGRPQSLHDVSRLFRWSADGAFSEVPVSKDTNAAYRHAAAEVDAYARNVQRAAPRSPVPTKVGYVPGLGDTYVPVPAAGVGARARAAGHDQTFAAALAAVQTGCHIWRSIWETGVYVTAQVGYPQGIGVNENTARATGLDAGRRVVFAPYLMRCEPQSVRVVDDEGESRAAPVFVPWTPDQADLFATDWRVLARPGAEQP